MIYDIGQRSTSDSNVHGIGHDFLSPQRDCHPAAGVSSGKHFAQKQHEKMG
jgi:hypothetical protein